MLRKMLSGPVKQLTKNKFACKYLVRQEATIGSQSLKFSCDTLCPNQQFFSHVGMGVPGSNRY